MVNVLLHLKERILIVIVSLYKRDNIIIMEAQARNELKMDLLVCKILK